MMKSAMKWCRVGAVVMTVMMLAALVCAQPGPGGPGRGGDRGTAARQDGPRRGFDPLQRLSKELKLTEAQQKKAKAIFEKQKTEMDKVLTPAQRKQMAERNKLLESLTPIKLTDAQEKKVAAIRTEEHKKIQAVMQKKGLTEEKQREQIRAIRTATEKKIDQVYTPAQRKQVAEQRKKVQALRERPRIQFTDAQRKKMQAITEKTMADFRAILTTEQKKTFDKLQAERRGGPGGPGGPEGGRGARMEKK